MSIRFRILLPMVIISILTASTILFFNVMQFSSFVDNYVERDLEKAIIKVDDEIEGLKMKSRTAVLYYANDNKLIDAMERKDQEAVLNRAKELFAQTDVESLTIVDADAIVIARAHNPHLYGDNTSEMPVVRSTLEGRPVLGAERGVSTSLSVRASSPVCNSRGKLLGALFAGDRLDTEKFVDRLKVFTGCEITVFVDGECVSTTLYGKDGERATGSLFSEYTEKAFSVGDGEIRRIIFQGRELLEKRISVLNNNGEVIGVVSVGEHLDEKWAMVMSFIVTGFLISVVFISLSILLIIFISRQIAEPISQSIDQARYDVLTGIFNRRSFEEHLSILLKTLSRSGGTVSLLMIDIDFFKNYNDTYGHIKGDNCLKTVASVLTQTLSRADDFVARYGGEEFVAVLPNTDEAGARFLSDELLEAMRKCGIPHENSDVADYVTISIGATTGRVDQSVSGTDFIKQADLMLYESKRNGRNMYTFMPMS